MSWRTFHPTLQGFFGSALCLLLFWGTYGRADADGDSTTDNLPRVIPYEGTIELDGVPFSGTLDMRFTLYDNGDNAVWSETYSTSGHSGRPVDVYGGTFSVLLGEYADLTDVVLDAEELYVGVTISADDFATETALNGRQLVGPTPFSIWASAGANFDVAGALDVGGNVTVGGTATTTGILRVGGADLSLGISDGRNQGTNTFQRALVHTGADALYINYAGDFEGGTTIQSNASVTGDLTTSNYLTVNQGAQFQCSSCGSTSTLRGTAEWGNMTIQGRVLSADENLHLSPPGGMSVIIEDTYRAAGGTTSGDGANLEVEGDVTVGDELVATNNEWGDGGDNSNDCGWYGLTAGSQNNGETLNGYCPDGMYVAGYERWHGSFDYGIERLELYCCRL